MNENLGYAVISVTAFILIVMWLTRKKPAKTIDEVTLHPINTDGFPRDEQLFCNSCGKLITKEEDRMHNGLCENCAWEEEDEEWNDDLMLGGGF